MLILAINHSLQELSGLLAQLSDADYARACPELGASIGEHTRHILEMFECLEDGYALGTVNYDRRRRDIRIQTSTVFASAKIATILQQLDRPDKPLQLLQSIGNQEIDIQSNYFRELLYNLEHCIHHQALIKVALLACPQVKVDRNFGIASSTIAYRNQCAP